MRTWNTKYRVDGERGTVHRDKVYLPLPVLVNIYKSLTLYYPLHEPVNEGALHPGPHTWYDPRTGTEWSFTRCEVMIENRATVCCMISRRGNISEEEDRIVIPFSQFEGMILELDLDFVSRAPSPHITPETPKPKVASEERF